MDAFFASVEQVVNPKLKGKPIAVIGAKERTVVVTCSYEAREWGVKTGMSKYEAMRLCPVLTLVTTQNRVYTHISTQITEFLRKITPKVEVYSIDEAFLDISDIRTDPKSVAFFIKAHVKSKFGVTCSVGLGSNKMLAKMASGVNKPDGVYLVKDGESIPFIDSFKLGEIWGIGKRLSRKFRNMGIFNTSDLRAFGRDRLYEKFGLHGLKLFEIANGRYYEGVKDRKEPVKSIGHSMTLPTDIYTREQAEPYLLQLSEMVSARARQRGFSGKSIHLTIRYHGMETDGKSHTFGFFTSATHHIYNEALVLFDKLWRDEAIRLLGISLGSLAENCVTLSNIFDEPKKWSEIYKVIDDINIKHGKQTVTFGSVLKCKRRGAKTISPAWRPDGTRNVEF
jgi:DNA polymerase-4